MQAKMLLDGEITIVSLSGRLEVEKTQNFKHACLKSFANKKVVFCMKNLSFVGSSGIQNFFNVLSELNADQEMSVKLAGLNADFQRVFKFSECSNLEMHENIEGAMQSFSITL